MPGQNVGQTERISAGLEIPELGDSGISAGILIGLGISRLDLTGYLEKTQEQEYHPVERKVTELVESKLKDPKQCWLCGSHERSMMGYFRKFDDLGVICTNQWYVMDMHIRNHDEDGNLTGPQGNGHIGYTGTGEGGCFFHTEQMSDYGISEVSVDYGEDSIFDVKKVQNHLCQECLDKLVESMEVFCEETQKPKPRDLVLVDFQTLELYALQEHNTGYFIRDYYVEIESEEDRVEVKAGAGSYYVKILEIKNTGEEETDTLRRF